LQKVDKQIKLVGDYGVIYKAKKKGTEEFRSIKCFRKSEVDPETENLFKQEIDILRHLVKQTLTYSIGSPKYC
jgi:serine/threonine protein kinase